MGGCVDLKAAPRFFDLLDLAGVGQVGRAFEQELFAIGRDHAVGHRGRGEDDIQIVLPLQPFLHDLHVEEAEKAEAESEPKGLTGLWFVGEGAVVLDAAFRGRHGDRGSHRSRWERGRRRPWVASARSRAAVAGPGRRRA